MGGGSGRKRPLGSAPTPVAAAQQAEGMMIDGAARRLGRRRERVEEGTTELSPYKLVGLGLGNSLPQAYWPP